MLKCLYELIFSYRRTLNAKTTSNEKTFFQFEFQNKYNLYTNLFHKLFFIFEYNIKQRNIQRYSQALWMRLPQFYLLPSREGPIGITINSIFPLGKWNSYNTAFTLWLTTNSIFYLFFLCTRNKGWAKKHE